MRKAMAQAERMAYEDAVTTLLCVVAATEAEWKAKADDLHAELDACHSECRNFSAETFRLKVSTS